MISLEEEKENRRFFAQDGWRGVVVTCPSQDLQSSTCDNQQRKNTPFHHCTNTPNQSPTQTATMSGYLHYTLELVERRCYERLNPDCEITLSDILELYQTTLWESREGGDDSESKLEEIEQAERVAWTSYCKFDVLPTVDLWRWLFCKFKDHSQISRTSQIQIYPRSKWTTSIFQIGPILTQGTWFTILCQRGRRQGREKESSQEQNISTPTRRL